MGVSIGQFPDERFNEQGVSFIRALPGEVFVKKTRSIKKKIIPLWPEFRERFLLYPQKQAEDREGGDNQRLIEHERVVNRSHDTFINN
jgi:hypothetical protein